MGLRGHWHHDTDTIMTMHPLPPPRPHWHHDGDDTTQRDPTHTLLFAYKHECEHRQCRICICVCMQVVMVTHQPNTWLVWSIPAGMEIHTPLQTRTRDQKYQPITGKVQV